MKRKSYYKVKEVMNKYRVPILIGLRRVGKTKILKQLKEEYGEIATIIRFDSLKIRAMTSLEIWNYLVSIINSKIKIYINPYFHLWILNKSFKELFERRKEHIIKAYWLFATTQINGYYKKFYYTKNDNGEEIDFVSLDHNGFKTLHKFKYSWNPTPNNLFYTTPSINKVIWSLKDEEEYIEGIKYENIIKF